jgi:hypothetical protein
VRLPYSFVGLTRVVVLVAPDLRVEPAASAAADLTAVGPAEVIITATRLTELRPRESAVPTIVSRRPSGASPALSLWGGSLFHHLKEHCRVSWSQRSLSPKHTNKPATARLC